MYACMLRKMQRLTIGSNALQRPPNGSDRNFPDSSFTAEVWALITQVPPKFHSCFSGGYSFLIIVAHVLISCLVQSSHSEAGLHI